MSSAYEFCHCQKRLLLLIEFASSEGWEVRRMSGGHMKLVKPGLPPIFTSLTASDHRASRKAWARLRWAEWSQPGDRNG